MKDKLKGFRHQSACQNCKHSVWFDNDGVDGYGCTRIAKRPKRAPHARLDWLEIWNKWKKESLVKASDICDGYTRIV